MSLTTTSSALRANLACLGHRNSDLARALEDTSPAQDLIFSETPEGILSATYGGRNLCSRRHPLAEVRRLIGPIDIVENAVFVVNGFGLGYHVQVLAERLKTHGLIVIFEPDLALLRSVFERIDHSSWMSKATIIWISDPVDRGALGQKLEQAETVLALGIAFIDHPASRARITEPARQFSEMFRDHMVSAKTTLMTSLIRSQDTVRNFLLNLDHYTAGAGIAELENLAQGHPGVIVSAGPSLQRNIQHLAQEGVRDRCLIIATQTTLKPLLKAGVRPHFVTALDYHEISKRFYEDLDPDSLRDVTLLVEPKAHPVIIDSFPGPVRCCSATFLDDVLGDLKRDMGTIPLGSTVAHLALYVARYLGCQPIAMIGQDLGFPDGLYYTPGTAIHDVWSPELNPFNTIAMMEWQRIVRHRLHLQKTMDSNGKSMYTDAQMITYQRQFERDFASYAEEGLDIIDATEGGAVIQHTRTMPLADVLDQYATRPLPRIPLPPLELDSERLKVTGTRVSEVRQEVAQFRELSLKTSRLIQRMLDEQHDVEKMAKYFRKMEDLRGLAEQRMWVFHLINNLNQLGLFKRVRADRKLQVLENLTPLERQRAELERDYHNVSWIAEAAQVLIGQLVQTERILAGGKVDIRQEFKADITAEEEGEAHQTPPHVAALIPVDPDRSGLGISRSLAEPFQGQPVIQATLERLGKSRTIESIILITPDSFDIEALLDRSRIDLPVEIESCDGSPFGPEQEAIAAARMWSETSWRGGIAGTSAYDEILCPGVMSRIMESRGLSAALLIGPDWPLINVIEEGGCDTLVRRHLEYPHKLQLVFTQSPPGLCGCLVGNTLMKQLTQRNRLSTLGSLLVYQPHAPQPDPIARDANVQIDHRLRRAMIRGTFDSPRNRKILEAACSANHCSPPSTLSAVQAIEHNLQEKPEPLPRHVILELTTTRQSRGLFQQSLRPHGQDKMIERSPLSLELASQIFEQLGTAGDVALTLAGLGDPLLHESVDQIIALAKESGIRAVQVRSELLADQSVIKRLVESGVDVVSVELHADRAATYEVMMDFDRFKETLQNLEYLKSIRNILVDHGPLNSIALPWIVPRLQRRFETYEDIETFYDRWMIELGTAVIESPPPFAPQPGQPADSLIPAITPAQVMRHELSRRMTILCDGGVPVSELDITGENCIGNVNQQSVNDLWQQLTHQRCNLEKTRGVDCPDLRTFLP